MSRSRAASLVVSFCVVLSVVAISPASAQLAGTWSGTYSLEHENGSLRIDVAAASRGVVMTRVEDGPFAKVPALGSVVSGELRTMLLLGGNAVELRGSAAGDRFSGTLASDDGRHGTVTLLRVPQLNATPDVTGTWTGSTPITFDCSYNSGTVHVPVTGNVNVTLALQQTNGAVGGTIEIDNVPNTDSQCKVNGTLPPLVGEVSASVSGNSISGAASLPGDKGPTVAPFSGTVDGTSMSLSFVMDHGGSFSPTLMQTSTQPPNGPLTGTWSGTVTSTIIPCGTLPPVTFTATITATFVQAGSSFTGDSVITGGKKDQQDSTGKCTVVDDAFAANTIWGQINGGAISGLSLDVTSNSRTVKPFTATLSGNTIAFTMPGDYPGESATATLTRSSATTPPPAIVSFAPAQSTIAPGGSTVLSWTVTNAVSVTIDNGVGVQGSFGSVSVSPKQTTTYSLSATGAGGTASATTTVTVSASSPQIAVSALPSGMLQAVNGTPASDRFSLTNTGGADANVTVSVNSGVFTVAPNSTTIPTGATRVFVVQATQQPAGTYSATATVTSNGAAQPISIPLTLLVAAPPTGSVVPQAASPRVDVSAPAGQNPTGSVNFTNSGSAQLQGIAVSDAPWIIPQSGVITIPPGGTQAVSFSIDRSKRPDASSPFGGATGRISLVYFGSGSSKGLTILGTTPTSTVSVTIVDVVKPGTTPGGPPPLQPGEVALWLDNLQSSQSGRINGDLAFSALGSAPSINDMKIFLGGSTSPSAVSSSVPQFSSNAAFSLPSFARTVFGVTTSPGPTQVRSASAASLSVSGIRLASTPNRKASFIGAVPTLRSDRSIGPGERAVITGVEAVPTSTDAVSASILVQEVSGNGGSVSFDYRDAAGNLIGSDSGQIPAFALAGGPLPAGTQSVVVTNTGTGRFAPFATVDDEVTADEFALVDPSLYAGSKSDTLVIPIVTSPAGQATTVYVTNSTSAPVTAGVELVTEGNRRHVARFSARSSSVQPATLNPLQTSRTTIGSTPGFVRVTGPAGSLSAAGRATVSGYTGAYGSSLPAVPVSAALANGQTKRFTAVDDASDASIAAATPATYRSSVVLIETAGQPATVRITLRYMFQAGSFVSAQATSSRDFALQPNEMLDVTDLARSVIGGQRSSFGDLHNMLVDVSVVDGSGRVVPFAVSVDNGSGDLVVRTD